MRYFPQLRFALLLPLCSLAIADLPAPPEAPAMDPTERARQDAIAADRLTTDLKRLGALTAALEEMAGDGDALRAEFGVEQRGFYTSDEHDKIEDLLFRYLICRETLWEMVDFHRDYERHFTSEEDRTRSFVIGFAAASELFYYSGRLIEDFLDTPYVIAKINEGFHRSEIPVGTWDTIFNSLTEPEHLRDVGAAWQIFAGEITNSGSTLSRLAREEPNYARLIGEIGRLHNDADARVRRILEKSSLLLPDVRNALRHSELTRIAQSAIRSAGGAIYAIRGLTFTKFSRIKRPGTPPVEFSDAQVKQMRELLEPGDIILTYSQGFMSNLFLPGTFKHGITYVGPPEKRRAAGLYGYAESLPPERRDRFLSHLETSRLPDGSDAELIEALAEGVIFNSLDNLLTARINRLVVLRPKFSPEQRAATLGQVFSLLGADYDFKFDFNDATYQCCTEVIYRAFNKRGPIELDLTPRMGRPTLSADDIVNYALARPDEAFGFVVLAVPDIASGGRRPRLHVGDGVADRLRLLMNQ